MHLSHAGCRGVCLLESFEDGIWGNVRLLAAVLALALPVLYRLPPSGLVFVVRVILLVLHPETLSFLHERPLLSFIEKSVRTNDQLLNQSVSAVIHKQKGANCGGKMKFYIYILTKNQTVHANRYVKSAELFTAHPHLPPEFSECLAELRVVKVRVLIRQLPPSSLSPHHERVHWSLNVGLILGRSVNAHRHGHEGPVVTLEHLGHGFADASGKLVFLVLLEVAQRSVRSEQPVLRRPGVLGVGARARRARGARRVLGHARARGVRETLVLFLRHLQVGVEEIHTKNCLVPIYA